MINHRFQLYQRLEDRRAAIMDRIRRVPEQISMPEQWRNRRLGLLGGSGLHAAPRDEVLKAIYEGSSRLEGMKTLNARLRTLIKDHYGDEWDALCIGTGEAALHLVTDVLMAPALAGRGDGYRARYVAPYERHTHHQAGYGTPFPPAYKDIHSERGATSGEFGMMGKRLWNLDVVFVRMAGARYEAHGIRQFTCPLLRHVDPDATAAAIRRAAETHAPWLSGFASMGYTTPGYGYSALDADGVSILQHRIGDTAREFGVPYLVDNARGTPFMGNDPRKIGATVMIYSTDKAFNGPTGGLIIGREEAMVQLRRAMGMHGSRSGTVESHEKAAYVAFDPGKEAAIGVIKCLELLQEDPESFTRPVDELHEIAQQELASALPERLLQGIMVSKSYNSLAVEIDYTGTWDNGQWGLPIFSIEDMYAGSNLVQAALPAMGMLAGMLGYDGNIILAPGMGTTDRSGRLIQEAAVFALRCLARSLAIIYEEAYGDEAIGPARPATARQEATHAAR
jgi:hypothetical protein